MIKRPRRCRTPPKRHRMSSQVACRGRSGCPLSWRTARDASRYGFCCPRPPLSRPPTPVGAGPCVWCWRRKALQVGTRAERDAMARWGSQERLVSMMLVSLRGVPVVPRASSKEPQGEFKPPPPLVPAVLWNWPLPAATAGHVCGAKSPSAIHGAFRWPSYVRSAPFSAGAGAMASGARLMCGQGHGCAKAPDRS